jgi:hypothetical protein
MFLLDKRSKRMFWKSTSPRTSAEPLHEKANHAQAKSQDRKHLAMESLFDRNFPQQFEVAENLACA